MMSGLRGIYFLREAPETAVSRTGGRRKEFIEYTYALDSPDEKSELHRSGASGAQEGRLGAFRRTTARNPRRPSMRISRGRK
jgi:hypothetical protein